MILVISLSDCIGYLLHVWIGGDGCIEIKGGNWAGVKSVNQKHSTPHVGDVPCQHNTLIRFTNLETSVAGGLSA